ncbi:MAG TPA: GNAT family N-acetyltransferase [Holophaga sp.]|nr:GNAT family N-acetyltransferase [Holophaga sp.]
MLTLGPYDPVHLDALAALRPQGASPNALHHELTDLARGRGAQVRIAFDDGRPCGVAGWVTLGIGATGTMYGAPVLAGTEAAARALLACLVDVSSRLGARQLRVSCFPDEAPKADALRTLGFSPRLDLIGVARPSAGLPEASVPPFLRPIPIEQVDWDHFAEAFNTVFAEVPNAPPVGAEMRRQDWEAMDREASGVWLDEEGRYAAWIGVHPDGEVDEVGVLADLRGHGIARALYRAAGESLAARGAARLEALLASTNAATLALHAGLGFRECTRRTVFELALTA